MENPRQPRGRMFHQGNDNNAPAPVAADDGPRCIKCKKKLLFGTNLCALCANTMAPHDPLWKQLALIHQRDAWEEPDRIETKVTLVTHLEDAGSIQEAGDSTLAKNMDTWVGYACRFLDDRGYWNAEKATNFGDQHTPNGCTIGTTSLDFQGIREGSEGTCWIDLQGQIGGGSTKRKSYCQVLIQTRVGGPVDPDLITAALLQSLKGGKKRAIIKRQGEKGNPK